MTNFQLQRLRFVLGILSGRIRADIMDRKDYTNILGYDLGIWTTLPTWDHVQLKCEEIILEHLMILDPQDRKYT